MRAATAWTKPMYNLLMLLLGLILFSPAYAERAAEPERLHILSRESYQPKAFTLDDKDWRWLGNKRELHVAVCSLKSPALPLYRQRPLRGDDCRLHPSDSAVSGATR
ncbi:Uncharacterised protein [Cedecea neteri]|uniref:Uncharacterized protein n=1 Tax=Cedecea neteri TaxID=158822 RepID=A0A2X3L049_9ENTR|nr:Uncharacterised protein [Cedecea neteri]